MRKEDFGKVEIKVSKVRGNVYMLRGAGVNRAGANQWKVASAANTGKDLRSPAAARLWLVLDRVLATAGEQLMGAKLPLWTRDCP